MLYLGALLAEDYESAAARHYEDANRLRGLSRPDNAGYLVGFAAECAIKHRITSLRPLENAPHCHLPDILVAARTHFGPRSGYTDMYHIVKGDIFKGWSVANRYGQTGHTNEADLAQWFTTARRLLASAKVRVRI